jgi:hypothetical protein
MSFDDQSYATGSAAAALARNQAARNAVLGTQPRSGEGESADIAAIREKGFGSFVKEMQQDKMKKLREEILRGMGLSEDDLSKMDPNRRAETERMIADKIRQRLAAQSVVQSDGPGAQAGNSPPQVLAGGAAWGSAPALLQAMQEADAGIARQRERSEGG